MTHQLTKPSNPSTSPSSRFTLSSTFPCYNHAAYVDQALEAMCGQSRSADEVVVVDDASTDESVALIERYIKNHSEARLVRHEKNRGALGSLNHCLEESRCDYYYCGAADDYVLPGFFEAAMDAARRWPEAGIICGQILGVDHAGKVQKQYGPRLGKEPMFLSPREYQRVLLDGQAAYLSLSGATVYRREYLVEVGGYRLDLGSWADTFAMRAIGLKYGACYLPWPCTAWRRLPMSFSRTRLSNVGSKLRVVSRAAELMRTEEFRDRFPADHVRRWERSYRRAVWLTCARDAVKSISRGAFRRAA